MHTRAGPSNFAVERTSARRLIGFFSRSSRGPKPLTLERSASLCCTLAHGRNFARSFELRGFRLIFARNATRRYDTSELMSTLPPVDALSAELARLTASAEFWRNVRLFAIAATILLAILTFLAQAMEFRRSREIAALKEKQLQNELADRDVRIGNANLAAAQAQERTRVLEIDSIHAKEKQQLVEVELAKQREQTAKAELATEEIRRQNLEMQESLTPRVLVWGPFVQTKLHAFADTPWDLRVPPGDIEASTFGNLIGTVLERAGWKLASGSTDFSRGFADGVIIFVSKKSRFHDAGVQLAEYVMANRAFAVLIDGDGTPEDKVIVDVGPKPKSPILTPVLNEAERPALVQRDRQIKEQMERHRKAWRFPPYDK
jgi:hypothetical protein